MRLRILEVIPYIRSYILKKIKEVLKEIIKSKGLKQRFVAQKLGVSEVTVSNWVKGKTYPTEEHWVKLSTLLDISLENLKQGKW